MGLGFGLEFGSGFGSGFRFGSGFGLGFGFGSVLGLVSGSGWVEAAEEHRDVAEHRHGEKAARLEL